MIICRSQITSSELDDGVLDVGMGLGLDNARLHSGAHDLSKTRRPPRQSSENIDDPNVDPTPVSQRQRREDKVKQMHAMANTQPGFAAFYLPVAHMHHLVEQVSLFLESP